METQVLNTIVLGACSGLLMIAGYFVRLLHRDFLQLVKEVQQIRTTLTVLGDRVVAADERIRSLEKSVEQSLRDKH